MSEIQYGINEIESLSFKEGVRKKIAMYLGSADMMGVYAAIQEIISNSVDEYLMGFGTEIDIELGKDNMVVVTDRGRGIPFGIREDGSNVLVDIFSKPHTGGKFNNKVYNSVAGINGIGAKATCLSSKYFNVSVVRDGKWAKAGWVKGDLVRYEEGETDSQETFTSIQFAPDPEVFNLEEIKIDFEVLKKKCRNLTYLAKGLRFNLDNGREKVSYCAENGILDLIKEVAKDPVHPTPIFLEGEEDNMKVEVALQWTRNKEQSFVFTNGLENVEGGTSLTGMKTAVTTFIKKYFTGEFSGDLARTGLVYIVSAKIPNPSFANQTKTKINNPELRGFTQRLTSLALKDFSERRRAEFDEVIEFLTKERKAEIAAARARKQVLNATKDIERNQKKKVFASDKLKDAEFLGENSVLLVVEGDSAAGAIAKARDYTKYGILGIRGKLINALTHSDEKIFQNEEIKLLLSALNITPGRYNPKKLRYGSLAICTDADSDGYHIGLLIMAALHRLAPEFIAEGRLYWLRSPLYIVKKGQQEQYYYTDSEFSKAPKNGIVQRAKGLGALSPEQAKKSMFGENQRMDKLIPSAEALTLLEDLMGVAVEPRAKFIFENVDFSKINE